MKVYYAFLNDRDINDIRTQCQNIDVCYLCDGTDETCPAVVNGNCHCFDCHHTFNYKNKIKKAKRFFEILYIKDKVTLFEGDIETLNFVRSHKGSLEAKKDDIIFVATKLKEILEKSKIDGEYIDDMNNFQKIFEERLLHRGSYNWGKQMINNNFTEYELDYLKKNIERYFKEKAEYKRQELFKLTESVLINLSMSNNVKCVKFCENCGNCAIVINEETGEVTDRHCCVIRSDSDKDVTPFDYCSKWRKKEQTLCWTCQNVVDCEWSNGQPVPGWDAIPSAIITDRNNSYNVKRCPKYIPDEERRKDDEN